MGEGIERDKLPVIKLISQGDVMYSMVTRPNDTHCVGENC